MMITLMIQAKLVEFAHYGTGFSPATMCREKKENN